MLEGLGALVTVGRALVRKRQRIASAAERLADWVSKRTGVSIFQRWS
jgi:hypothetical protein